MEARSLWNDIFNVLRENFQPTFLPSEITFQEQGENTDFFRQTKTAPSGPQEKKNSNLFNSILSFISKVIRKKWKV